MKYPSHPRVPQALHALDYDFWQFRLIDFAQHIERALHISIELLRYAQLPRSIFGAWIRSGTQHMLLVRTDMQPIHQQHTLLHHLGHLVLDHPAEVIDSLQVPDQTDPTQHIPFEGRVRALLPAGRIYTPEEQEAEAFAFAVQSRVLRFQRLAELIGLSSSIPELGTLTRRLPYEGSQ